MKMLQLIFKLHKNKLLDKAISTMHKHNKLKKWVRNLITLPWTKKKCLKNQRSKSKATKTKLIFESKTSWDWKNKTRFKETTLKCLNLNLHRWLNKLWILKKNLSWNLVKTIDLEVKLQNLRSQFKIYMDQEKERGLFMLSWIIWKLTMKNSSSFLRHLVSTKIVRIQRLWEELSTYRIRVLPIFAKHLI